MSIRFPRRLADSPASSAVRWSRISRRPLRRSATATMAIAVSSGTDALRFALMACGVQAGRCRGHRAEYVHRHDRSDLAGRRAPGIRGYRRAHLQHVCRDACSGISRSSAFATRSGRLISLRSGRPVTPVVPVHLYGQMADMDRDSGAGRGVRPDGDRGCLPGAWRRVLLAEAQNRWMKAGSMGTRRGVQLLSGQESGRLRRRRCGHAPMIQTSADEDEDAARSRTSEEVLPRSSRATTAGSMQFRREFCTRSCRILRNGMRSAETARPNTTGFLARNDDALRVPYEPSWSRAVSITST